jgi:uncharacterized protein (TIGR03086 family)
MSRSSKTAAAQAPTVAVMTSPALLIGTAAAPHAALVRAAAHASLDVPTPCGSWDLHALLAHLLHWTPVLADAGRGAPVTPPDESADPVVGDWADLLNGARDRLAETWSNPVSWEGTVSLGGPEPLPAAMIGGMVLGEIVLHGWDLGRALDLEPDWPEDVLAAALGAVEGMAPQGREMGVFGPEVPVGDDASTLDRIVAVSGRDPSWSPR